MKKGYIGIDPGSPISMALISPSGKWIAMAGDELVSSKKGGKVTNVPEAFVHFIKLWDSKTKYPLTMIIENIGPRPGEGVVSASKFVASMWMARVTAIALDMEYHLVAPSKWKRDLKLSSDKELSRALAMKLWPNRVDKLKYKKDHNRAEAALLGYYGLKEGL